MLRNVFVLGMGKSGVAAASLLRKLGNYKVWCADEYLPILAKPTPDLFWIAREQELPPVSFDFAVISPGIPPTSPLYRQVVKRQIPLLSEIELAARELTNPMIGITGTNGKSTFCTQLASLIPESLPVGNIGLPLASCVGQIPASTLLIVELSSFQLELLEAPLFDRVVVLEITSDHLDRYRSLEAYKKAKMRIVRCIKQGGSVYAHHSIEENIQGAYRFSQTRPLLQLLSKEYGALVGEKELKELPTLEHRLEFVKEVGGVAYYNDSKGTNIASVLYSVAQLSSPLILIVGGVDKGGGYKEWVALFADKVKLVLTIGQAAEKIEKALLGTVPVCSAHTLDRAVHFAGERSKKGDVVLFSPGCSSYDQFSNFEERGRKFKQYVASLQKKGSL